MYFVLFYQRYSYDMIARDVTTKYTENGKQNEATKAIKSSTPQKDSRDYYYATLQKFAGLPISYNIL